MRLAGTIVFFAAVAGANIFIVLYTLLARWWKNPFGRHLFSFMAVVALALNYIVLQLIWAMIVPDRAMPYRLQSRFVLYTALAVVIWWRIVILIRVQWRGRRGASQAKHAQEVPRDGNAGVGGAGDSDVAVVERKHPMAGSDERVG